MITRYNEFCIHAHLDREDARFQRTRGKLYGQFMITGDAPGKWYGTFGGLEFTAEMIFVKNDQGKRKILNVVPVIFQGRNVWRGRPIPGEAVAMV